MTFSDLKFFLWADLYRYDGKTGIRNFLLLFLIEPGFRYSTLLRINTYLRQRKLTRYTLYIVLRLLLEHYSFKYGIAISPSSSIGAGLYIPHFGGIVVHQNVEIGKNCNLHQGVTLGQSNRGERKGCPILKDNVWIGPGAKIFGSITIGNNVVIGANCVVTRDVPDDAVVAGIPANIISYKGADGYVNHTDYDSVYRQAAGFGK